LNLKSFAKVNLFLKVLRKRSDGYHSLKTIFERINLTDSIALKNRRDNLIRVKCSDKTLPCGEANLCFRAAKLLRDKFFPSGGVDIRITKRIPVGAGLGGGSGNAAAVLSGLNKLWGLKLSRVKLAKLAARIGSDAAFFIYDLPFAMGSGRGERVKPLDNLRKSRLWHLLVVPKIHVSTPLIYENWDNFTGLTKPHCDVKILLLALAKKGLPLKPGLLFNSLEQVTIRLYPEVKRVKYALSKLGLNSVLMSGSGPAVFAITSSAKEALRLAGIIRKSHKSWRVFAVSTV